MKFNPQKTAITSAISLAISSMVCVPALADSITGILIEDVGSVLNGIPGGGGPAAAYSSALDGNSAGFRFSDINPTTYGGVSAWTGDAGTGTMLGGGAANPTGSFSTGFIFSGAPFIPYTFASGFLGDIVVDNVGNPSLSVPTLDFGGNFGPGTNFNLPPDPGSLNINFIERGVNPGEYLVNFQWLHDITTADDPALSYTSFTARWIVEGVASVDDTSGPSIYINDAGGTPSAVSGDISIDVLSNSPYTDTGALCQDVFDGDITANVTTTPVNPDRADTGAAGTSFTVVYDCQDSGTNNAPSVTKTVNVTSNDTVPPVVTLLSPGTPEPGREDPDPATVNILQGKTYVDAGATCNDNVDGDISGSVVPGGTVDTNVVGSYPLTFDCMDTAGNPAVQQVRTVNVIADNEAPVIAILGANPLTIAVGSAYNDPGATCTDTNPIDPDPIDISGNLNVNPTTIDTSSPSTTAVTYDCNDASGNPAPQQTRTVEVALGSNFRIISMTITDLDNDGLGGCFKFNELNPVTCAGANFFTSDNSGDTGSGGGARILGVGDDKDGSGNPIGIQFETGAVGSGSFQPITQFRDPSTPPVVDTQAQVPVGPIAPGFLFTQFPFVPTTFDPNAATGGANPEVALPPRGFVTVTSPSSALVTMESLPFGGLFNSSKPNLFFLDPDEGTFAATVTAVNNDDNGTTRTFNYSMTWNHLITDAEDPTGQFPGFDAFWRLEGVITADSTPFVVNNPPTITTRTASQDSRDPTTIITTDGGLVTASVTADDLDGDTLTYDWSQSPVPAVGATNQSSFTFDSSALQEGPLALLVIVSDGIGSIVGEIILSVEDTAPVLSGTEDSDGNGLSDAAEGFGDSDFDGIPEYQDPIDGTMDPGRNRIDFSSPSRGDIVASAGRLRLGGTASAVADGTFVVTEDDIRQYGGNGATPTSNYHDRLNDVLSVGPIPNGIRDFIIDGLPVGGTVQIVIPQDDPLPPVPEIRKYTVDTGWIPFSRVSGNAWASAPKVAGVCPGPNDPAYDSLDSNLQTFMVEGDECVRLTIVDGGGNDADRTRNGVVIDPSTVSGNGTASSASTNKGGVFGSSGSCSLSSNASTKPVGGDWMLLLMGVLGLFGYNRSRKSAAPSERKQ